ncbi:MAG: hypothetical protein WBC71_07340 [Salaquimonas sp.]
MKAKIAVLLAGLMSVSLLGSASNGAAQAKWNITQLDADSYPAEIVAETRGAAKAGLVDGLIATHNGGDIASAWYSEPTERYDHAILGDNIEAGQLNVKTSKNRVYKFVLPKSEVFEDQTPRLADLDGDGSVEVITIRSSVVRGGSVTIYGLFGTALIEKATTGFFGKRNRWLNVAGIAPFLGSEFIEFAYVETPHIGGTLYFYRYKDGQLQRISAATNFSNHAIGSREMRLSAVADVDSNGTTDIALPSADRKSLRVMGFKRNKLKDLASADLPAKIDKAIAVQNEGDKGFVVGLEDGSVYLVHP